MPFVGGAGSPGWIRVDDCRKAHWMASLLQFTIDTKVVATEGAGSEDAHSKLWFGGKLRGRRGLWGQGDG